jgi:hypothetical protein
MIISTFPFHFHADSFHILVVIFTLFGHDQKHVPLKASLLFYPGFTVKSKAHSVPEHSSHHGISQQMQAFCVIKAALLMATTVQTAKERRLLTPITIIKAPSPDQKNKSILTRIKFVSKQLKHLKIQNMLTYWEVF